MTRARRERTPWAAAAASGQGAEPGEQAPERTPADAGETGDTAPAAGPEEPAAVPAPPGPEAEASPPPAPPPAAPRPLAAAELLRACDPASFSFATTADLPELAEAVGQERALEALAFGTTIRHDGYNVFALGPPGVGKHEAVMRRLAEAAAGQPNPADWAYVHNFEDAHRPRCLRLPPGRAASLARDLSRLVEELRSAIPAALGGDEHRARRRMVEEQYRQRYEEALGEVEAKAGERSVGLLRTPMGVALAPVHEGHVYEPDEFLRLPEEDQARFRKDLSELQEQLQAVLGSLPRWESERRARLREVEREVAGFALDHLLADLRERWQDVPAVLAHLDAIRADALDSPSELAAEPGEAEAAARRAAAVEGRTRRYRANVFVDRSSETGAPVVYEDHPTAVNLVGRVEHRSEMGALVTDFLLVRPGALHRANGGFLVLDARKVLLQPLAWEELKRALRSHQVRIEPPGHSLGLVSTVTLEPEPIPLDVKVALVGDRYLYYLLAAHDPDFPDLFKVAADFDDRLPRDAEGERLYALLLGALAGRHGLLPLDRTGVARAIEHAARLSGESDRLSTHVQTLLDLLQEADHRARTAGRPVLGAGDVQGAIDAQTRRADRVRQRVNEEIARGTVLVETGGRRVGQVNGLSVLQLGGFAFGRPNRITARVRVGTGQVVDIEREVALGGPIHSKGVLILTGFLGGRFCGDRPLSLAASLVFEQSYSGIEGDSASAAELLALLSALSEVPLSQSIALTGSVDQHGRIQPVGGVNEKVEGFFDACLARGLDGEQGVILPEANVRSLMLRKDVVEAVAGGRFHVWAARHVDEVLGLLTGLAAGEAGGDGSFPDGSVNRRVHDRLALFAEKARNQKAADRPAAEKAPPKPAEPPAPSGPGRRR